MINISEILKASKFISPLTKYLTRSSNLIYVISLCTQKPTINEMYIKVYSKNNIYTS